MSLKTKLSQLTNDQLKLTAAKNATADPRMRRILEQKQQMMSRRIGKLQSKQKADNCYNKVNDSH